MPKRTRDSGVGVSDGEAVVERSAPKRLRESDAGLGGERRRKRQQLQPVRLPGTLTRLKDSQELLVLRYPASFDLASLQGCTVSAALLASALGGGQTLQLAQGGQARLCAAPHAVASQGMYVAVVGGSEAPAAAAAAAAAAAGGEEAEPPPPSVSLLPAPVSLVLDLALVPQTSALQGLRRVVLTRRAPVAKAAVAR